MLGKIGHMSVDNNGKWSSQLNTKGQTLVGPKQLLGKSTFHIIQTLDCELIDFLKFVCST